MHRRTVLGAAVAAAVGTAITPAIAHADSTTTVDPLTRWGRWDGWGTSLCWLGQAYGDRDDLADIFFTGNAVSYNGSTLPGLDLNIVRYNAGACSWNTVNGQSMVVSPNIKRSRQMEGFWLDPASTDPSSSSWDWTVDANQRAMLAKANARGANVFELFSNSPMWWMCVNHNPSGSDGGASDNLQAGYRRHHAIYLATVAKYAHDNWDVDFDYIEAFNESISTYWRSTGTQEGCHFDASTQATVIGYLHDELLSRGLGTSKITASDENTVTLARTVWQSYPADVQAKVTKINAHGYGYERAGRADLYAAAESTNRVLWNSEYGEADGTGLRMATNLTLDLRQLHPTAWIYWQVLDGGGWGLIQADENAVGGPTVGSVNTKYYVLAQFTRHIRPGMLIIDGGNANTVAAYDQFNRRLVLVTTSTMAQTITYDLGRFGSVGGGPGGLVRRWVTQTGGGDAYSPHTDTYLSGRTFSCAVDANSVQTFEIENVSLPDS